ncbi:MAG: arginine deiminase-related protein [Bacteroidota bacterium]
MKERQITNTVLMVRPAHFGYNPQTAANNAFQSAETQLSTTEIQILAVQEFDQMTQKLREAKIEIIIVPDTEHPVKYDAVFPNNWFSTHAGKHIITYPVFAPMRRRERRMDIIHKLEAKFGYKQHITLEQYEAQTLFLEGTGSMILDRPNRVAYACRSVRTDEIVMDDFCEKMAYKKVLFDAVDEAEQPIYHTNVMMAMGETFVIICMDTIQDESERATLEENFAQTNKTIINISLEQMSAFAGNMLQLRNANEDTFLVMSEQAYRSLRADQKSQIEQHTNILHSPLYIIEKFGGGSARCMMAEIF